MTEALNADDCHLKVRFPLGRRASRGCSMVVHIRRHRQANCPSTIKSMRSFRLWHVEDLQRKSPLTAFNPACCHSFGRLQPQHAYSHVNRPRASGFRPWQSSDEALLHLGSCFLCTADVSQRPP